MASPSPTVPFDKAYTKSSATIDLRDIWQRDGEDSYNKVISYFKNTRQELAEVNARRQRQGLMPIGPGHQLHIYPNSEEAYAFWQRHKHVQSEDHRPGFDPPTVETGSEWDKVLTHFCVENIGWRDDRTRNFWNVVMKLDVEDLPTQDVLSRIWNPATKVAKMRGYSTQDRYKYFEPPSTASNSASSGSSSDQATAPSPSSSTASSVGHAEPAGPAESATAGAASSSGSPDASASRASQALVDVDFESPYKPAGSDDASFTKGTLLTVNFSRLRSVASNIP
ncbi:hypothetical protein ACM66B_005868 [Microbotryomycetes sp. NB124-2]